MQSDLPDVPPEAGFRRQTSYCSCCSTLLPFTVHARPSTVQSDTREEALLLEIFGGCIHLGSVAPGKIAPHRLALTLLPYVCPLNGQTHHMVGPLTGAERCCCGF